MLSLNPVILERGIRAIFASEFVTRQRKVRYPNYVAVVDSDKEEEKFNAISTLPQLEKLTDERNLAGFSEYSYTLKNEFYATGIKLPRKVFEFDQTGQVRTLVQSLGARVANFPDYLMDQLLVPVHSATGPYWGTCYTGKSFFAANAAAITAAGTWANWTEAFSSVGHDLGNGSGQANVFPGNLDNADVDAVTKDGWLDAVAKFSADLNRAKSYLLEVTDDRGEPWHDDASPESLILICHPRMERLARTALGGTMIAATDNVMAKTVGQVICPVRQDIFKDANGVVRYGLFFLLKIDTAVRPFIFQRFSPPVHLAEGPAEADQQLVQSLQSVEIQSIMRTGSEISEHTFFNDEFLFGARTIYTGGYGMWQNALAILPADYAVAIGD
jgi:phage major head subunit gpT-like protein